MIDTKLKNFIINTLRRASFRWKPRGESKKRYKVKIGEFSTGRAKYGYRCSDCKEIFKSGEVKVDHIEPVVDPVKGFVGFDEYIERMFCGEDNFQILCPGCHDIKTAREKDFRMRFRKLEKDSEEFKELQKECEEFMQEYKIERLENEHQKEKQKD